MNHTIFELKVQCSKNIETGCKWKIQFPEPKKGLYSNEEAQSKTAKEFAETTQSQMEKMFVFVCHASMVWTLDHGDDFAQSCYHGNRALWNDGRWELRFDLTRTSNMDI